jgi:hypothetical protein
MPARFGGREVRPFPGGLGKIRTDRTSIIVAIGKPVADAILSGGMPASFMCEIRLRTLRVIGF